MVSLIASGFPLFDGMAETPGGEDVFNTNCSVCHSVNPPPKSAPPVVPLANRYYQKYATKEEGVAAMVAFLKEPDKNKAVDEQAASRFGLMPAIPLSDEELKAVSEWFLGSVQPGDGQRQGLRRRQTAAYKPLMVKFV